MVDTRALGALGTPFEFVVEHGKLAEFTRAIKTHHVAYTGEHAVVPPTFLTTMFHWERAVDESNPWHSVQMDKQRGMHAEQEYIFHGPPPQIGDRLTAVSRIDRIFEKQGRRGGSLTFVIMVTDFRRSDGTLVAEAKMTAVETGQAPEATS